MRNRLLSITALAIATFGCRTTGGGGMGQSEAKGFGGPEEVAAAQKQFVDAIIKCTPMILALVPGDGKVDLGEADKREVIEKFVGGMVQEPKTPFDLSARLAKYYENDKAASQIPPCGGEAVEYLIFNFAGRTNVLSLKSNSAAPLKILY